MPALAMAMLLLQAGCLPVNGISVFPEDLEPTAAVGYETNVTALPVEEAGNTYSPEASSTPIAASQPVTQSTDRAYFTPSPTPSTTPDQAPSFQACSPLEGHSLSDLWEIISFPYDPPPPGKESGHHGVDFAYYRRGERLSILGVPVQSVLPGRVAAANDNRIPYGNMVIIETVFEQLPEPLIALLGIPRNHSLYLLYAHMEDAPLPVSGEIVVCGQTLGTVGNTPLGWSSAPHLHFEVRFGPPGVTFSGMRFYDSRASLEEMDLYTLWRTSGHYEIVDPMVLLVYGLEVENQERD